MQQSLESHSNAAAMRARHPACCAGRSCARRLPAPRSARRLRCLSEHQGSSAPCRSADGPPGQPVARRPRCRNRSIPGATRHLRWRHLPGRALGSSHARAPPPPPRDFAEPCDGCADLLVHTVTTDHEHRIEQDHRTCLLRADCVRGGGTICSGQTAGQRAREDRTLHCPPRAGIGLHGPRGVLCGTWRLVPCRAVAAIWSGERAW